MAAHCNCMAGLGEACSHVASLMFYIDAAVRIRDSKTVTQEKAYWMLPSALDKVDYVPVSDMDFTSPSTKKRKLDKNIESLDSGDNGADKAIVILSSQKKKMHIPKPTDTEIEQFFEQISKNNCKPAILSTVPPYSKNYIPSPLTENFPQVMTELNEPKTFTLTFNELLEHCESVSLKVTKKQYEAVEKATKQQSASQTWFRFKAGRISGSTMKACCHTNPDLPSQSLIKRICHPTSYKLSSASTQWGCDHEKTAIEKYSEVMADKHTNFTVKDSGFIISTKYPFIGASPDGIVSCDCCGTGVLEIKCPFCIKDKMVQQGCALQGFCLELDSGGKQLLSKKHAYYYQVQTEINICEEAMYADFVVWTVADIHIERILPDAEFWSELVSKATEFYKKCLLPELVGKFYSRSSCPLPDHLLTDTDTGIVPLSNTNHGKESEIASISPEKWCYCGGQEEKGRPMISCDNGYCPIVWFHFDCLNISKVPSGSWYCPDCRKIEQFKPKRKKKS